MAINAKQELLQMLKGKPKVKCAKIYTDEREIILKIGWNKEDWENLLKQMDFGYYNGYGGQELFGLVWFEDGTWLSRGEYDGSEWWEYNKQPNIPKECY